MTISITAPGEYITRNGSRVTIHTITQASSFPCEGTLWFKNKRSIMRSGELSWDRSGQFELRSKPRFDIVGPHPEQMTETTTP